MKPVNLKELEPGQRVVVVQPDDSAFVAELSSDRETWSVEIPDPLLTDGYYCGWDLGDDPKVQEDDLIYLLPSRKFNGKY